MYLVASIIGSLALGLSPAPGVRADRPVKPLVRWKAEPFDLNQVRLLDGPFRHALELDVAYLRSLPVDRLLHNFRVNAGLPSSAQPLGGWEEPTCEVRGHFVGHYLTACAMAVRATGDPVLKANADAVVAGLAECQSRFPSGYLSAFPETFFDRLERRENVWVPWYTLHKIDQGLLDMYTLTGNRQALETLKKACAWAKQRTDRLTDEQMQRTLDTEHGGINETFANLYAVTGDRQYLTLSLRFDHRAVLDPLARREDHLTGLHANTQFPKVIGVARQYELTGDERFRTIAEFFWNTVTRERSYVTGGNSNNEGFSPREELSKHISPTTTETCNTYNMLRLTRHIFAWNGGIEQADYYERALYNHILASQNPETGMTTYYVTLKSGTARSDKTPYGFSDPFNSFWCCTGTGVENHVKYGDSIYWHDANRALFVNLFLASELNWSQRGLTIRQTTRFPDESGSTLEITAARPVRLTIYIRRPGWVGPGFSVSVNGSSMPLQTDRPGYVAITRSWKTGDTIRVALPMTIRTESFRDDPNRYAFLYGPIVLCADTERGSATACTLAPPSAAVAAVRAVNGQPLTFACDGAVFRTSLNGPSHPVVFRPFFRAYDRPMVVYWDAVDEAGWSVRVQRHQARLARARELDLRTIDRVIPGDAASESAHHLQGERTGDGPLEDGRWRHAVNGGWFSWDLNVGPEAPRDLVVTFWGSDSGPRTFDILVDNVKVGEMTLRNNAPGEFFDHVLPLPDDLLSGKSTITVRFQGRPGNYAGGVFGLRIVRRQPPEE